MFNRQGPGRFSDLLPARPIAAECGSRQPRAARAGSTQLHQARSGESSELAARMQAYELAAKMQLAVPRVTDLSRRNGRHAGQYGLDQDDDPRLSAAIACSPAG